MASDRFDQSARFIARFDPEGMLGWLFPGFADHLRFTRWLDTRTAQGPADGTLDSIERNEISNTLLALIPLMKNGGEEGIIQRWSALAQRQPSTRRRDELGSVALILAELKPWLAAWQTALKEWNMRESTVIQGWINQGINQGKLEQQKQTLRRLVAKRFGKVDAELERRIHQSEDLDALQRATEAVLDVADATTLLR